MTVQDITAAMLSDMAHAVGYNSYQWRRRPAVLSEPYRNHYSTEVSHPEWQWLCDRGLAICASRDGRWATFSLTAGGIQIVTGWLLTAPRDRWRFVDLINGDLMAGLHLPNGIPNNPAPDEP